MHYTKGCRRRAVLWLFLVLTAASLASCCFFESGIRIPVVKQEIKPPEPPPCEGPYCASDLNYPLDAVKNPRLYVCKSERRLLLIEDKLLVREYQVSLGPSPAGDKYYRGDGRTPEGEFIVCAKNPASQYYKSLGINYPDPRHAEAGLEWGVINTAQYKNIIQANENKKMPPSNTPLGGAIFIHGGGCVADWTLGCIAVPNRVIDELFTIVPVGTPVTIVP